MTGQASLSTNRYILDILGQPTAVRRALEQQEFPGLETIARRLQEGNFDRIVLTGMGASYYGLYPAYLQLAAAGYPVMWIDSAELIHNAPDAVGPKTLLWIVSQSGRSAEVAALLEWAAQSPEAPAGLIAVSNDADNPLAEAAQSMEQAQPGSACFLALNAAPEETPSTRTYLLTLALCQLAAIVLIGGDTMRRVDDLMLTLKGIESYLADWEQHMGAIGAALIGLDERAPLPALALLGRGPSFTSAMAGALNLQEAAKIPALGLQSAEFRHGPLEIADGGLSALIFAGAPGPQRELNRKLWGELRERGARAVLLGGEDGGGALPLPAWAGIGLPLAEIVPVQLLCVYICLKNGMTPGEFRNIGKVTTEE